MEDTMIMTRMNEIENLILQLRREVRESKSPNNDSLSTQKYFTLREAVELKYGKNMPYTTISTNYALMPCGNTNFEIVAGIRRWKSEFIKEWINIADKDLVTYLSKYHVPLTGRIGEKYKKYIKKEDSV